MNGLPSRELEAERFRRLDEPCPEGESWREAVARMVGFLDELVTPHRSERVLLIGHVATRWALDHHILGRDLNELVASPFHWQQGWEYRLRRPQETQQSLGERSSA